MSPEQYREIAASVQLETATDFSYLIPGLAEEAGEVAGKYAKYVRDSVPFPEFEKNVTKELSDVVWFVDRLAAKLGLTIPDLFQINAAKLLDRQSRGKISGSGDDR